MIKHSEEDVNALVASGNKRYVLPDFQRGFVWERSKQRDLLASFLVRLPIGSLLILEAGDRRLACRELCSPGRIAAPASCSYILDGQQRLSTIKSAFFDLFPDPSQWKQTWEDMFKRLRYRWFARVIPEEEESDVFGYRRLKFVGLELLTQDQMVDFIESRAIRKTQKDWFHPAFCPLDKKGKPLTAKKAELELARMAATEGLVPLYSVADGPRGLHRRTLEQLALRRAEELKAETSGDRKKVLQILEGVDPDLDDCEKEEWTSRVEAAWTTLRIQWANAVSLALEELIKVKLPTIQLPESEMQRAVAIFEALNRGGTPLSVYDLVVAIAAKEAGSDNLTDRIQGELRASIQIGAPMGAPKKLRKWSAIPMDVIQAAREITPTAQALLLNTLSLLVYAKTGREKLSVPLIKREKVLELSSKDINTGIKRAAVAFRRALAFLQLRCGIATLGEVPYRLMVLPLAYYLVDDKTWKNKARLDALEYWYWAALFGGRYQMAQNERCIEDIRKLDGFLKDFEAPEEWRVDRIFAAPEYCDESTLTRSSGEIAEPAALRDAVLQYLLSNGPRDFLRSERLTAANIASGGQLVEIHHVLPLASAATLEKSSQELRTKPLDPLNSVLNLALVLKDTNRRLGARSPADYVRVVDWKALVGHCLPEDREQYSKALEDNGPTEFLKARFKLIRTAIGTELLNLVPE